MGCPIPSLSIPARLPACILNLPPHTRLQGLDVGPESNALINKALSDCKTVLWNGPMGGEAPPPAPACAAFMHAGEL